MDPAGGHPMWLSGLVPPVPGLSYEVMVDGHEYEFGILAAAQWRLNAFNHIVDPLIESTEPAHFPLMTIKAKYLKSSFQVYSTE
jgi:hypothetical protein